MSMNDAAPSRNEAFQRADGLLTAAVNDELLMMSVESGTYFNLNPVGARIWELLETPTTLERLVAQLVAEYEVAPDTAQDEAERFLGTLHERGLLKPGDGTAT